jgi:type VI secretion system protein ImpC
MFPSDSALETKFTFESSSQPLPEEPPFNLLLLGDWSGKSSSLISDLGLKRPILIDRDNFDEVMSKLNVNLDLDLNNDGENILSFQFKEIEDFHPDKIFQQVSLFEDLRDLRRRLLNENSFNEAAGEVRSWFAETLASEEPQFEKKSEPTETEITEENSGNLLDNILNQSHENTSIKTSQVTHYSELSRFLNKIVSPYIVQTDENEQAKLLQTVDDATGNLMRLILHHPKFQALESAWRGIYLIVRKVETDVDLKIFLLDLSKDDLLSNLKSSDNLSDTDLYKWLIKETIETPGGEPWAVICGDYTFKLNVDDVAALIRLTKLSQTANAPFIAHSLPEMFGFSSFSETPNLSAWNIAQDSSESKLWVALRTLPESNFLGLVIPRFLARLPYGKSTDPTETFSFEEFIEVSEHNNYLWSNPSFVCGLLLAQTFRKYSWEMSQNFQLSLSDLPTHIYQEDGETKTKPCAEILMTDDICQKLFEEGLIPLISFKNTDRVQLGGFQSVSLPLQGLRGRWK